MVQEHKIARALGDKRLKGEAGKSFIPSTYLAKAEFTPAFFNLQKLKDFDTPFMSLVEKYNKAPTKQKKLAFKEQIETLKNTFNKNFFDEKCFKNMNINSFFINTARGELVDEKQLLLSVKKKIIKATDNQKGSSFL